MPKSQHIERLQVRTHFAAGDPIPDFGGSGTAWFPAKMELVRPVSIHEVAAGKLLVGVTQQPDGDKPIAQVGDLVRFDANGSLDRSFGVGGVTETFFDTLAGVTPTAGGRFYAAGTVIDHTGQTRPSWWLARFNGDGTLDRRFGDRGRVPVQARVIPQALRADFAHLSRDGVLTLNGVYPGGGTRGPLAIARFRPDGSADPAFGRSGVLEFEPFSSEVRLQAFAADGSFYTVQEPFGPLATARATAVLRKFTAAGAPDARFGTGGEIVSRPQAQFTGVDVVGADVFVKVAGRSFDDGSILKLDARGRTDRGFGGANSLSPDLGGELLRQADGKLLSAGFTFGRYNSDGSLDRSIENAGVAAGLHVLGRNGMLYSAAQGRVFATSIDGRGTPIAIANDNGLVTAFGTPVSDSLRADLIGFNESEDTPGTLKIERDGHFCSFDNAAVTGVLVEAGRGNDFVSSTVRGGITVSGGAGNDTISLSFAGPHAVVGGGEGDDTIEIFGNGFVASGDDGNDALFAGFPFGQPPGNHPVATLRGGRGDDRLRVIVESQYRGTRGFSLFGNAGNDYVRSSFTSDTLTGGGGDDTLLSGGGEDIFVDG